MIFISLSAAVQNNILSFISLEFIYTEPVVLYVYINSGQNIFQYVGFLFMVHTRTFVLRKQY